MSPLEARRLLGVPDGAGPDEVRAARRRLAKHSHPDLSGGDAEEMRRLNQAADIVLASLGVDVGVGVGIGLDREPEARPRPGGRRAHDVASFVIEALPAEAFEALLVVTSWLGEVVVDDPPYQLDVVLLDPLRCWCRLDLVPDAGASTVSLTLAAVADAPLPELDDVRDIWVAALNTLGRP
jgi:hypothetical protein